MRKRAYIAPVAAFVVLLAVDAGCAPPGNPWTVVSIRERRAGEVPFEEAGCYLRPSPDANNVLGPDSLVARVHTDEKLHPHIDIENLRTNQSILLFKAIAFYPRWSPNGKYIACAVWKSAKQNAELTIVDVASRTVVVDPEVRASATEFKWSPDSRMVAAQGTIHESPYTMLYAVSVLAGNVMVLDTVDVLTDYEFSWSPDGRWIAFSRPTALDDDDNPTAADLWIADAAKGKAWCVLKTPDWVESDPLWITNRTIQVDRVRWDGSNRGMEQRVVIELSTEKVTKGADQMGGRKGGKP